VYIDVHLFSRKQINHGPYVTISRKLRTTTLRRDAQQRQDRLLQAAVELYGSDGFNVPLDRIAERAGVSRPTLYRNYPDREALSAAVLQVHVDELTSQIAQWTGRDDAFILALRLLAEKTITAGGLEKIVPVHRQVPSASQAFRKAVERSLVEPLARAKAAGLVREDFRIADVHRAILMIAGAGLESYGADISASIERGLGLLLRGIAPPAAVPAAPSAIAE
jgi:AcrR family transcriptional regulator